MSKNKYKQILSSLQVGRNIADYPIHDGEIVTFTIKKCPYGCNTDHCPILSAITTINRLMFIDDKYEPFSIGKALHIDFFGPKEWVVSLYSQGMLISECIPLQNTSHNSTPLGVHRRFFQSPEVVLITADKQNILNAIVNNIMDRYLPPYVDELTDHDIFFNDHSPKIKPFIPRFSRYHV